MKNWLCVSAGIVVGEWFYFTISNGNGLFKCNIEKKQIDYLGKFPNEKEDKSHLFYRISRYKSMLFFWAHQARNHAMYDLQNNEFIDVTSDSINVNFIENLVFRDHNIYIYGANSIPYIYKYDIRNDIGSYIFRDINAIKEYNSLTILASGMDYDERCLYLPSHTNGILSFDWCTERLALLQLPSVNACYVSIVSKGDSLYLLDVKGRLMRYDKVSGFLKILVDSKNINANLTDRKSVYHALLCYEDCLYMIPSGKSCEIIRYNYETDEVYPSVQNLMRSNIGYIELHDSMLFAFDNLKGTLIRMDLKTFDTVEVDCVDVFNIAGYEKSNEYYIIEGVHICNSLSAYVQNIENILKSNTNMCNYGTKIYEENKNENRSNHHRSNI